MEDIKKRLSKVKNDSVKCTYDIEKILILGSFITITTNIIWIDITKNESYLTTQVLVWLIDDKKIKESWVIMDKKADSSSTAHEESGDVSTLPDSFSQSEAQEFFENLYDDIFVNSRTNLLSTYYHDDFIGHCNDEIFDLQDVKERATILAQYADKIKIMIKKIMVSDRLVTISNQISFSLKSNGTIYEVAQYATFRIQDKKLKEGWVVNDQELGSYRDYNQSITWQHGSDLLLPFEFNQKKKKEYINNIKIALEMNERNYSMPKRELECLYYYLSGYSAKETAIEMNLSPRTIESYILHIKNKFNCRNRIELRNILFPNT